MLLNLLCVLNISLRWMLGNGIASGEDMPVFLKKLLLLRVCPLENLQFTILSVVCLKKKNTVSFLKGFQPNILRAFSLKIKCKRKIKRSYKIKTRSVLSYSCMTFTVLPYLGCFVILWECLSCQLSDFCWNGRRTILSRPESCDNSDTWFLLVLESMPS